MLKTKNTINSINTHLLHVAKHILAAVENTFALFRVQVEEKICGVVCITFLIPEGMTEKKQFDVIYAGTSCLSRLLEK